LLSEDFVKIAISKPAILKSEINSLDIILHPPTFWHDFLFKNLAYKL